MDINRLRELSGLLTESIQVNEVDTRKMTNELHRMMDEGEIDPRAVADAALLFMSEDDVAQMMHSNEIMPYGEDDFDESAQVDERILSVEEIHAKIEEAKDAAMQLARDLEDLAPHIGLDDSEMREMGDWLAGLAGDLDSI